MTKDIQEEANDSFKYFAKKIKKQVKKLHSKNDKTVEEVREEIEQEVLETATGKEFNGTRTYMILLGTGGPAMRIIGKLNEFGEPDTAEYQYQDWFTEWTTAEGSKYSEDLLEYAQVFYFEG